MCLTCGCGDEDNVRVSTMTGRHDEHIHAHPHDQAHGHGHEHGHEHGHGHGYPGAGGHEHTAGPHASARTEKLVLGEQILAKNDQLAEHNRGWLGQRRITAVNLMSSPGSGKTSLLERTIAELQSSREICVIEGDQETLFDAQRIKDAGARAVQVNTGAGCHLDAPMVQQAIEALEPSEGSLLFIENVGNLVCPALFDVGEQAKVVVISVTEGDDKPLKYPHMFGAADLVVVNKTDLLPYVDFDVAALAKHARSLNPDLEIISLSVRSGENLDLWYAWLHAL
jgi:hydrogenase nickel incorporation protein HypB